ncbi:TolC family protein [Flammeovirga sp. MY04]|uniref:TolC family protein n=1 Tax=Flammeovirga sp. MY04 TaxID=1191459 RepID=UPI0008062BA1|nr:TolC family protein [Flammeovirga sp. MY04]ANQ52527.1 TolC family protein [Flammeovirga sp. MY04]
MKNLGVLIGVMCLSLSSLYGQIATDPFLQEYRKDAVNHEQLVKMAEGNVEISYQQYKTTIADMMPKLDASADYWYVQNPMTFSLPDDARLGELSGAELGGLANHQYGLYTSVTQPIYQGGVLKERKQKAAVANQIKMDELSITTQDVIMATDLQYWQTVAQKEVVKAMKDYEHDLIRVQDLVSQKLSFGQANKSDVLMTEVRVKRAQLAVVQSENTYKLFLMSLNRLIGKEFEEGTVVSDSILINHPQYSELQHITRPELLVKEKMLQLEEHDKKIISGMYRPQLSGVGTASYSSPGYNMLPGAVPNVQAGLMLNIPIYNAGKKTQLKTAQQIKIQNASLAVERENELQQLEIAQKRVAYENAMKETEIAYSSLTKARENAAVLEDRFTKGMIEILEVIDAQLYVEQAVVEYIQSKLKAQIQMTYYTRAIGHLTIN